MLFDDDAVLCGAGAGEGAGKCGVAARRIAEVGGRLSERGYADERLQPGIQCDAAFLRDPGERDAGDEPDGAVSVSGGNVGAGQRGQHGRIDRNRRNDGTQRRRGVLGGGRDDELGDGVAGRGGFRVCGNSERQIQSGGAY